MTVRHVIGCMTGTSIDALDAALVRVERQGLGVRAVMVAAASRPLGALGPALRAMAEQHPMAAGDVAHLARDFALLHAEACDGLARGARLRPDLIAVHGQTVFHAPPVSWQMFNPWPLVEAARAPVVFDLRGADVARGGQGAPITPLADWVLFRADEPRAVVNLGGFCNLTVLPAMPAVATGRTPTPEAVRGFDVCSCNHVLDAVARAMLDAEFDDGGKAALAGEVLAGPLEELSGVLSGQTRVKREGGGSGSRSLGTGDEVAEWVARHRETASGSDLAATACEAIGGTIARRTQGAVRVLLAGGGTRNACLVKAITGWASAKVELVDAFGVPAGYREAVEIAVLGALCQDRVPVTLGAVTGVRSAPVAGVWAYPG